MHIVNLIKEAYSNPRKFKGDTSKPRYCVGGAFMMAMDDGYEKYNFPNQIQLAEAISKFKYGTARKFHQFTNETIFLIRANDSYHYKRAWDKLEYLLGEDGEIQ